MKPTHTKAIELMQMDGVLRFSKEGIWTHDGSPVTHPGVAQYFSKHLEFDATSKQYVIAVGNKAVAVEVEDTPLVVMVLMDVGSAWRLLLSDDSDEVFAPETFKMKHGEMYCVVRGAEARFRRVAAQSLSKYVQERDGQVGLVIDGKFYPVNEDGV